MNEAGVEVRGESEEGQEAKVTPSFCLEQLNCAIPEEEKTGKEEVLGEGGRRCCFRHEESEVL